MALLDFEGFDLFGTFVNEWAGKFTAVDGTPTVVTGRGGEGKALRCGSSVRVYRPLFHATTNGTTAVYGFGLIINGTSAGGTVVDFYTGVVRASIRMASSGVVSFYQASTERLAATVSAPVGSWFYLEVKVLWHTSAGSVEFRINGVPAGSVSGVATYISAVPNELRFTSNISGNTDHDDYYCNDTTGSIHNDFLGPRRVLARTPSATVSNTLTGLTGAASAHEATDEIGPDEDTSYIDSDTAGHKALFSHAGVSVSEVNGVRAVVRAKKDGSGARAIRTALKSGATEVNGSTVVPGTSAYQYVQGNVRETDPDTSAAWTVSDANAITFGPEIL